MLAFARADLRRTALGDAPLESVTPRTITDRAALEVELAEVRERGWAEDHEEFAEGVCCVAASVLLDGVAAAAYTVSAPTDRFTRRHDELLAAVRRAAAAAGGSDADSPESR